MPLRNPITESQIPQPIARDTEFIAADTAHVLAPDPHPQYLTPARADERYGATKKHIFFGTTPINQGGVVGIGTTLNSFKICSISGVVQHTPNGDVIAPNNILGYEFSLSSSGTTNAAVIYLSTVSNRSANIVNKPFRIVVEYMF